MKKRLTALLLALCIAMGAMLVATPAVAAGITVYVSSNTLPVYNRISGRTVLLGTMSFGEEMLCVAVNKDWACVKNSSGAIGYCKTEGLTNVNPNKYSVRLYANASGVKVYDKPDTSSAVLKKLNLNDVYTGVAITNDSKWIRLKNGSSYGYVLAPQMSTQAVNSGGIATADTVYVAVNTLPVYASDRTSSKKLGTMAFGESMGLLGMNGQWAKVVNTEGTVGYCKAESLVTSNPNTLSLKVYIAKDSAKIYKKPNTSAAVVKKAALNASYTAVAITTDGEWLRLKNGDSFGYVRAEDVSTTTAETESTVYVSDNVLSVYAGKSTSSKRMGRMAYGESMELLEVDGDWAKVRNTSNETGYCAASGLTYQNPNLYNSAVYAAVNGAQIYKKPDKSLGTLASAKLNQTLTAVAITGDGLWMRVITTNGYGYIHTDDVSDVPVDVGDQTVYVSRNTLVVYQSATAASKALGTMAYGESMTLHEENGTWAKVENDKGEIGFCEVAGLTIENPNNMNAKGFISADGVKVYAKPDASAKQLKSLNRNAEVTVVALTPDMLWARVLTAGSYGYVLAEYVPNSEVGDTDPSVTYVSANTVKVYKEASESTKLMGTMSYGEAMTLLSVDDGWAKVMNASGETGYCSYGSLSSANPNTRNEVQYAQSKITLYQKPMVGAASVKSVNKNTALTVIAVTPDGEWARVMLSATQFAYAQTENLAATEAGSGDDFANGSMTNKTVYGIATSTVCYAAPTTGAKSVGHLYFGQSATCTGDNGEWARVVNSSGTVAYCKVSSISTENPNKYSVSVYAKSAGTKVYQKPSTTSSVIATVGKNGKCTAIAVSQDGQWYRLKNGSTYGYVKASDFSTAAGESGVSSKISKVISIAEDQYGKKYVYGAKGPSSFDCSGLVYYAYQNGAGITLPRTAEKMGYSSSYTKISNISDLKAGDLVFFDTSSDSDLCDHVGIYLGSGYFVHASSAAGKVVKSSLENGYYNRVFSWGRRVL